MYRFLLTVVLTVMLSVSPWAQEGEYDPSMFGLSQDLETLRAQAASGDIAAMSMLVMALSEEDSPDYDPDGACAWHDRISEEGAGHSAVFGDILARAGLDCGERLGTPTDPCGDISARFYWVECGEEEPSNDCEETTVEICDEPRVIAFTPSGEEVVINEGYSRTVTYTCNEGVWTMSSTAGICELTYVWDVGMWGSCNSSCMQSRVVRCIAEQTGEVVADSMCNPLNRPDDSRECNTGDCGCEPVGTYDPYGSGMIFCGTSPARYYINAPYGEIGERYTDTVRFDSGEYREGGRYCVDFYTCTGNFVCEAPGEWSWSCGGCSVDQNCY